MMGKISIGSNIIYDDTQNNGDSEKFIYKGQTREIEITSGTSINLTIPSHTTIGDLIVLVVYNRSNITIPAGFTEAVSYYFGSMQYNRIYYKIATENDLVINITQSASGRMAASLIIFRCNGVPMIKDYNSNFVESGRPTIPDFIADTNDLIIILCSNIGHPTTGTVVIGIDSRHVSNLALPIVSIPRICYGFNFYSGILSGLMYSSGGDNTSRAAITGAVFSIV